MLKGQIFGLGTQKSIFVLKNSPFRSKWSLFQKGVQNQEWQVDFHQNLGKAVKSGLNSWGSTSESATRSLGVKKRFLVSRHFGVILGQKSTFGIHKPKLRFCDPDH